MSSKQKQHEQKFRKVFVLSFLQNPFCKRTQEPFLGTPGAMVNLLCRIKNNIEHSMKSNCVTISKRLGGRTTQLCFDYCFDAWESYIFEKKCYFLNATGCLGDWFVLFFTFIKQSFKTPKLVRNRFIKNNSSLIREFFNILYYTICTL